MAVSISNLTTGNDTDGNTTSTTASVSPASNKLLLLTVTSRTGIDTNPNQPTASGNSLTWEVVNSVVYDTTSSSRRRVTVLRAMGASPSSGAITIDFGGQNQTNVIWNLEELSGIDTSGSNGSGAIMQSATNKDESGTATSLTVTLGTFGNTGNATFGCFSADVAGTYTAGSGFSISQQSNSGVDLSIATEFKNSNDTSVDISDASGWGAVGGIAIEIRVAGVLIFDATSNSGAQNNVTSYSWNHTCTGTNLILVVGVMGEENGTTSNMPVTGVTYNGVAMTKSDEEVTLSGSGDVASMWYLINPATGTHAVQVTHTGQVSASMGGAVSYTGADQSGNPHKHGSAQDTSGSSGTASKSLTSTVDGCVYVDVVTGSGSTNVLTPDASQTSRWNITNTGNCRGGGSTFAQTSAGAKTTQWTFTPQVWAYCALVIEPVQTAATVNTRIGTITLMGVGN